MKEFFVESYEGLDTIDRHLATVRAGADNSVELTEIFRAVHTMKGTVGFFGLPQLGQLAHAGEALLAKLRDGELCFDAEIKTLLLQFADRLRDLLRRLEERGHEGRCSVGKEDAMLAALQRVVTRGRAMVQQPFQARAACDGDPHRQLCEPQLKMNDSVESVQ